MLGEEGFVSGVDGREIVQVFHEYGRFHNVAYFQASGFHDSFNVFQRLTCLSGYVFRYGTGFRIDRDLTEVITMLPRSTPCTYGPIAAGAFSVAIVLLMISPELQR